MAVLRAQLHVSPRGRLEHPELALARGPAAEGETGDGSLGALYGYPWALVWDKTRPELVLCRVEGGELVEVEPLEPLPALTVPARHIALAFDGSARPMIAWQARDGIRVRQWDPGAGAYTVRGPFPGQDPVLVPDALALRTVAGSDVVLGYLSTDRAALLARLERDLYGVAYPLAELAPAPSGRPWYLDQVTVLPWRLQWVLATDDVTTETRGLPAAEQRLERAVYRSELYPVTGADAAAPLVELAGALQETTRAESAGDTAAPAAALAGTLQEITGTQSGADAAALQPAALAGTLQGTTTPLTGADGPAVVAVALAGTLRLDAHSYSHADGAAVAVELGGQLRHVA